MTRKPPIRTCIACGATSDKRSLVRIVRSPEGEVYLDPTGRAAGRGAYVCCSVPCFEKLRKKRLLDSRLRTRVGTQDYDRIEEAFVAQLVEEQSGMEDKKGADPFV